MQRIVKNSVFIFITALLLVSCNNGASLQRYYVDNQETPNFTSIDLPVSILKMDESKLTDNQKEAYSSVKRLNFLGYRLDKDNLDAFNTELGKVKTILKDKKYNDLMEFNDKNAKVSVKYLGNDDTADEFIVFASSNEMGFGIVRVLGDKMSPEKMMTLADAMKNSNIDESQLGGIMDFFKK
ncbi:DUF4252 domain-containing protein [Gaetbulibacter aquiaggeris]|uniref:DUF4252 domain-containing protein n=1 Tax=Gaetbulibacter aquiaggeris TaxID=1735373 RepID=A0ABW7MSK3_9FLAO